MKQKVSTVPKGKLSILGIGPYPRKNRNVKSILTESRNILLSRFQHLWN